MDGAPREITDAEQIKWSCIEATQLAYKGDGAVAVVCTPSGGAQSVRLDLSHVTQSSSFHHPLCSYSAAVAPAASAYNKA